MSANTPITMFLSLFFMSIVVNNCAIEQQVAEHNNDADYFWQLDPDLLTPYKERSPYRSVLVDCVTARKNEDSCTLDTLPLIAMEPKEVSIEMVLDRLVVSKGLEWLGDGFETYLRQSPKEILPMFEAVTAIVIADTIIPEHYAFRTGAIYMKPTDFGQQKEQIAKLTPKKDERGTYQKTMPIKRKWWFTVNGWNDLSAIEQKHLEITRQIFHELFHASDIFNKETIVDLLSEETIYVNRAKILDQGKSISQLLEAEHALITDIWKQAAQVLWDDKEPTDELLRIEPLDYAALFELESAVTPYGYFSSLEDSAMLFEVAMMEIAVEAGRKIKFYDQRPDSPCYEKMIWGSIGRIHEPHIKTRAQFVVDKVFPGLEIGNREESYLLEPECAF